MRKFAYILIPIAVLSIATSNSCKSYGHIEDTIGSSGTTGVDDVTGMHTLSNVYYATEVDSLGNASNSILDTIDGLEHITIAREWCYPEDSVRFDAIVDIYMDTVYATEAIRKHLFSKMDDALLGLFEYREEPAPSLSPAPYTMSSAGEYANAWGKLMDKATKLYGGSKVSGDFHEILPLFWFICCHKVYEDQSLVTYLVEHGNEIHGGGGCRNVADYLTFDKATSKLLTTADIVKKSNRENIYNSLKEAYLNKFPQKSEFGPELVDSVSGVAVIDEGMLFYYYPYTIGSGSDGQINLVLDRSMFPKSIKASGR